MTDPWFAPLKPLCEAACADARAPRATDAVLFYLARWCQKETEEAEPDLASIDASALREAAAKIVQHLRDEGGVVDRLVAGDAAAWTELRRALLATAGPRVEGRASEFADEALQKIAVVLLTGTPPSRASERLRLGPRGPRNEYVFISPFSFWAKAVLLNLIVDEHRRAAREREPPPPLPPSRR
jgi:hypothetical protein